MTPVYNSHNRRCTHTHHAATPVSAVATRHTQHCSVVACTAVGVCVHHRLTAAIRLGTGRCDCVLASAAPAVAVHGGCGATSTTVRSTERHPIAVHTWRIDMQPWPVHHAVRTRLDKRSGNATLLATRADAGQCSTPHWCRVVADNRDDATTDRGRG